MRSRLRPAALAVLALALLVLPFAWWRPSLGVWAALGASAAAWALYPRRRALPIAFLVFAAAATYTLYFTWRGYWWTHAGQLRSLAAEVAAYGKIRGLEMGTDDSYVKDGRRIPYDSYRFLNGALVTHYRGQQAPGAYQPVYYIDDYCRAHGLSKERYLHFRSALDRLGLHGLDYEPETGTVSFVLDEEGGNPVVTTLEFIPRGGAPDSPQYARVAPRWFVVRRA